MMALVWTCLSPTIVFITSDPGHGDEKKVELRDRLIKELKQDVDILVFGILVSHLALQQ